jgi:hypothetical protein
MEIRGEAENRDKRSEIRASGLILEVSPSISVCQAAIRREGKTGDKRSEIRTDALISDLCSLISAYEA